MDGDPAGQWSCGQYSRKRAIAKGATQISLSIVMGGHTASCGCGSKLLHQGTAGFSPRFQLPGFHFGVSLFLAHSHVQRFSPLGEWPGRALATRRLRHLASRLLLWKPTQSAKLGNWPKQLLLAFLRGAMTWVWVKIKPPGYGPQVLVHVSTYQGSSWGTYF